MSHKLPFCRINGINQSINELSNGEFPISNKLSLVNLNSGDVYDIGINVKIGEFCIFNSYCNFGHDITIGDYTDVMSEMLMGGECNIGKHNYFGLRCTVINQVDTVDHCTFGACACVVKDAPEPGTYVGVPAKLVKPLKK